MTSVMTPNLNSDAAVFGLQTQSLGQIFEPLKKQWENSSFDRLFQNVDADPACAPAETRETLSGNLSSDTGASGTTAVPTHGASRQPLNADQAFEAAQQSVSVSGGTEQSTSLVAGQDWDPLATLQATKNFSSHSGETDADSTTREIEVRAKTLPTDAAEITAQTVVVGIEGEKARVWMRGSDLGMTKAQLIAKIRTELSWAGIALGNFVLNGEKLVG